LNKEGQNVKKSFGSKESTLDHKSSHYLQDLVSLNFECKRENQ